MMFFIIATIFVSFVIFFGTLFVEIKTGKRIHAIGVIISISILILAILGV